LSRKTLTHDLGSRASGSHIPLDEITPLENANAHHLEIIGGHETHIGHIRRRPAFDLKARGETIATSGDRNPRRYGGNLDTREVFDAREKFFDEAAGGIVRIFGMRKRQ